MPWTFKFCILFLFSSPMWANSSHPCAGDVKAYGGGFNLREIESYNYHVFDQNLGEVSETCRGFVIGKLQEQSPCLPHLVSLCRGKKLNLNQRKRCAYKYRQELPIACIDLLIEKPDAEVCDKIVRQFCDTKLSQQECRRWFVNEPNQPGKKCRSVVLTSYLAEKKHMATLAPGESGIGPCAKDFEAFCPAASSEMDKEYCLERNYSKVSKACYNQRVKRFIFDDCHTEIIKYCGLNSDAPLENCLKAQGKNLSKKCHTQMKRWPKPL